MTKLHSILEETIEAWEDARQGVVMEVENIPANKFAFRAAEGMRTASELVSHIMDVALMMTGELTREDTNLHRAPWPQLLAMHNKRIQGLTTKKELLGALRSTLRDGVKAFREAGELHMLQRIVRFDGQLGTRLAWFNHGIAHENYHGGQLAFLQRFMGITPALTKRIMGA